LNVQDLDLRNAELRVRGKGGKERIVPLGEVVREYLGRYLISFLVRSYGRKAGIRKRVSPHSFRQYVDLGNMGSKKHKSLSNR